MKKNRRETVLIDRKFQFKLIAKFIAVNILIMILFGFILYMFLNSEVESNLATAHARYRDIKSMLFPIILTLSVINIIVSSMAIGIFVLFASHKIAGPIYRFNEELKKINSRNIRSVTPLRDGDQLYECSYTLQSTAQVLKDDFLLIKEKINELKALHGNSRGKGEAVEKIIEIEDIIGCYRV